jgi:F-type H+-transporting ATPase subunit b
LALRDLAGVELEQRVAEAFLMRLAQADAAIRAEFVEAVREADGRVLVTGGFAVPQEMQPRLVQALRELAGRDVDAAFHVSPDLIAGLEVRAGGCKIAWSLEDFLQGLEAAWAEALADLPGRRPA